MCSPHGLHFWLPFFLVLRGKARHRGFFDLITKSPVYTPFRAFGNEAEKPFLLPVFIGVSHQKVSPMRWGAAIPAKLLPGKIIFNLCGANLTLAHDQ
jgi:hypothetical protein